MDAIPLISQGKSLLQFLTGNIEGAVRTQDNFTKQCLGISQLRSGIELVCGEPEAALNTHKEFLRGMKQLTDSTPVVGHVASLAYYASGDENGAYNAWKSASRTTGVVLAGAVAGPVGAISIAAVIDKSLTEYESARDGKFRPNGYVKHLAKVVKNPGDIGKVIDAIGSVALDGRAGEKAKKATTVKKILLSKNDRFIREVDNDSDSDDD